MNHKRSDVCYLYPQLPRTLAREHVKEIKALQIEDLETCYKPSMESLFYTPTGGAVIDPSTLEQLRQEMLQIASLYGYPSTISNAGDFDAHMSQWLHENMNIRPSEACRDGVWSFIGLMLIPEISRWRFPGKDATVESRFLGNARGIKNTLGRLWWRAEYLYQEPGSFSYRGLLDRISPQERLLLTDEPYGLVRILNEDELVQVTERPFLAGNRAFCRAIARAHIIAYSRSTTGRRSDLLRESIKKLLRMGGILAFEALEEHDLFHVLLEVFEQCASSLEALENRT